MPCRSFVSWGLNPLDTNDTHFANESIEPIGDLHRSRMFHQINAIIRRPDLRVRFLPRIVDQPQQHRANFATLGGSQAIDLLQRLLMEHELSTVHPFPLSVLLQCPSASASETREVPARRSPRRRASSDNSWAVCRSSGTENISSNKYAVIHLRSSGVRWSMISFSSAVLISCSGCHSAPRRANPEFRHWQLGKLATQGAISSRDRLTVVSGVAPRRSDRCYCFPPTA